MTLYKYVVPQRIDVLEKGRIRFTQGNALNDPFELRPFFDLIVPEAMILAGIEGMDLAPHLREGYEKLDPELREQVTVDQFLDLARSTLSTDEGRAIFWETIAGALQWIRDFTPTFREQIAEQFQSRFGILSLSEAPDNALMWAHYGASHRGFIIAFDEKHEFFDRRRGENDEFYWLRKVEYQSPQPGATLLDLGRTAFLLRKSPQWAYEREWRILAPVVDASEVVPSNDGPICLFDVPPGAVTGIVLGARVTEETSVLLEQLLREDPRYTHLSLEQATLDTERDSIRVHPRTF